MSVPSVWRNPGPNSRRSFKGHFINDVTNAAHASLPEIGSHTIRVASYNVHFWTDVWERMNFLSVSETISALGAHLVGLQEVLASATGRADSNGWSIPDVFSSFVGYRASFYPASKVQARNNTSFGNALLSQTLVPVVNRGGLLLTGTTENRNMLYSEVLLPTGEVLSVGVVHLDVNDATGATRKRQIHSVLQYLDDYAKGKPTILMGDFNCMKREDYTDAQIAWLERNSNAGADFESIQGVLDAGFEDLFAGTTYTVWTGRRVDYIFTRNCSFDVVGKYVIPSGASDHFPLVVDLRLTLPHFDKFTSYGGSVIEARATELQRTCFGTGSMFRNGTTGYVLVDVSIVIACVMIIETNGTHEITNVCTSPEYRRKGHMTRLFRLIFHNLCPATLTLTVFKSNIAARRLYDALGFVTDRVMGDEYWMKKVLSSR